MKEKATFATLVLLVIVSLFSMSGIGKTQAYAEFDKSGNYTCNPFARGLETNIYADTVHTINDRMTLYLKTHPNATTQDRYNVAMLDQKTWDLYNKSKECISAIGVNPDDIIALNADVQQAIAVPEFGASAPMIIIIAIISGIVIYKKFNFKN
ncbi:MAG TPA: hypothetical protein VFJ23_03160 [Candidatus Nitrosotalea sp.]|nr:hypothetical protein [Candidatus Nitrosotalea sp.]